MKVIRLVGCVLALATLALAAIGLVGLRSATPASANPDTLYVDAAGVCGGNSPCYLHPQDAVNAANAGDTILVYPGVYNQRQFTTPVPPHWGPGDQYAPALIVWKDGLTIQAIDPSPDATVIQTLYTGWFNKANGASGGGSIEHSTGCTWNSGTNAWDGTCVRPLSGTPPNAVAIIASGVTLDGFTIHRPSPSANAGYNAAGVMIGGLYSGQGGLVGETLGFDNNTVKNCTFSNAWQAVYIWHSSGNQITGNTVAALGNTGAFTGITIYDGDTNATVGYGHLSKNNLISNNTLADKGILVGSGAATSPTNNSGTKILGNTLNDNMRFNRTNSSGVEISDNNLPGPNAGSIIFGSDSISGCTNCVVSGNTVGAQVGNGIELHHWTGGSVSGNNVASTAPGGSGTYGIGIYLLDSTGASITGNVTTDNGASGIDLVRTTNVLVSGNQILRNAGTTANPGGLTIREGVGSTTVVDNTINNNTKYGVWISPTALVGNVFHLNNIAANGVGMLNNTAFPVNAEDNWWGSANGPTHASNTFNVGSQGQSVSDNVDFVPWLDAPAPGGASFAPVTTTSPVGSYASIQAGVTASDPGGTVNAKAGTYDEQVIIGKGLTLEGAGDSTVVKPSSAAKLTTVLDALSWGGVKQVGAILAANVPDGSSVTVKNLKVDGQGVTALPAGADTVAGILYRETGGVLDTVTVTNLTVGATGTAVRGYGMYLSAGSNAVSVEVKGSTITNYDKTGIETAGNRLTVNIHHNTVTGRGSLPNGDEVQNGIHIDTGVVGTVDSNTVSDNSYAPETWWGAGILFVDSSGSSSAAGNILTNNQMGVMFQDANGSASGNTVSGGKLGIYAQATKAGTWTASFTGNTVGGSDTAGIGAATYASGASLAVTIDGNSLTGGTGDGVAIGDAPEYDPAGAVTATISGNTISGWRNGIWLASPLPGTTSVSADVGPNNSISAPVADPSNSGLHAMGSVNLNVHNNTFTGGYDAVRLRLSVTGTVKDNVMSGYAKNGITVGKAADDNTGTNVTVSDNTVTGGGPGQVNAQNGIQVGPNAVARIENNTVSNHVYTLGTGACAGPGTKGDAVYYGACDTAAGVLIYKGTATVTGNVITGNQVGIDDGGAEVHFNTISGNILFGEVNVSGGIANAEYNWWGACSGPTHVTNPLGTGDAVSDNVDFTPWITCDTDGDGCTAVQEAAMGFNDTRWYDFYDVPTPANPDMTPNGPRSGKVDIADALAVLFYFGAKEGGPANGNGVDYDSVKGSCDMNGDTVPDKEGLCYDRSPGPGPNPPWDAGPPNGKIDISDALAVVAQFGLDCRGAP